MRVVTRVSILLVAVRRVSEGGTHPRPEQEFEMIREMMGATCLTPVQAWTCMSGVA